VVVGRSTRSLAIFMETPSQELTVDVSPAVAKQLAVEWRWLLPEDMSVRAVSAIGDAFLSNASGHVFLLDVAAAGLTEITTSLAHFESLKNDREASEELFAESLVSRLVQQHGQLPVGSCFSITVPLTLGGKLDPENFRIIDVASHFRALAKIQAQALQLPIGAKIDRVVRGNEDG
jgi:hypothetical protein